MAVDVQRATREDAFAVAALQLQSDIEFGGTPRPGFIGEYADAWLAAYDQYPTWLAKRADGDPVGLVVARVDQKLPSLCRPRSRVMHIANVFVRQGSRGDGLAERILREVLAWGDANGVARYSLNAEPKARGLYERVGFGSANERWMELRRD